MVFRIFRCQAAWGEYLRKLDPALRQLKWTPFFSESLLELHSNQELEFDVDQTNDHLIAFLRQNRDTLQMINTPGPDFVEGRPSVDYESLFEGINMLTHVQTCKSEHIDFMVCKLR